MERRKETTIEARNKDEYETHYVRLKSLQVETQRQRGKGERERETFPRCNSYFQDPITIKIEEAFTLNSSFISWH